jgi:hypothetical protein
MASSFPVGTAKAKIGKNMFWSFTIYCKACWYFPEHYMTNEPKIVPHNINVKDTLSSNHEHCPILTFHANVGKYLVTKHVYLARTFYLSKNTEYKQSSGQSKLDIFGKN